MNDQLIALKAQHAPRLDREAFDALVAKLWPEASREPLHPTNQEAMWQAHQAYGLGVFALCAGFADAMKSAAKR